MIHKRRTHRHYSLLRTAPGMDAVRQFLGGGGDGGDSGDEEEEEALLVHVAGNSSSSSELTTEEEEEEEEEGGGEWVNGASHNQFDVSLPARHLVSGEHHSNMQAYM